MIFGGTVFYTLAISSVFVLRKTRPDLLRPYRTWGYPVTPVLYVIASFVLLGSMLVNNRFESLGGLLIIAMGLPVYAYYARRGRHPAPVETRG